MRDVVRLDDTIAAISTPVGQGGIGIVRLSGKDAVKIADAVFVSKDKKKVRSFKSYTVHYGHIRDKRPGIRGEGKRKDCIVDEVLLTVMRAPRSYTREDVVEINCHSGIASLRKILDLVLNNGARLAEPGEFTKRAFLNGRIDIVQAESVSDIIEAKTDLSLKAAMNNLGGLFSGKIKNIRDELLNILADIEASIDFSEEDISQAKRKDILSGLKDVRKSINRFIDRATQGKILRHGIKTVICGSPNVGKSSLMNAMLRESRAIVTDIAGTTRDTIEETINIEGIPVILIDTAGINKTEHPVEMEGVRRSQFYIREADIVLLVLDCSKKIKRSDIAIINTLKHKENMIIVLNKKDLKKKIDLTGLRRLLPRRPILYVSAITSSGVLKLEKKIKDIVYKGKVRTADLPSVSNDRQLDILRRSLRSIEEAASLIKNRGSLDCISICVKESIEKLGEITGDTITEEALNIIFSRFCIGK